MDLKLAGKTDLLDRIEAHLRDAPEDPQTLLGFAGIIGRTILRKR
jgi:hypothetical protein